MQQEAYNNEMKQYKVFGFFNHLKYNVLPDITHKTIVFWLKVHVMHLFRVWKYYYFIHWHLFIMRKEIEYFIVFNEWELNDHWSFLG